MCSIWNRETTEATPNEKYVGNYKLFNGVFEMSPESRIGHHLLSSSNILTLLLWGMCPLEDLLIGTLGMEMERERNYALS